MSELRIECPECRISYPVEPNAKTGPEDKVLLPCYCGVILEATFADAPVKRTWYGKRLPGEKVVSVSANPSGS